MTQVQEQKLTKYIAFRDYILQNSLTIEQHPQLKQFCAAFLNSLKFLLKTEEMMEESVDSNCNYTLLKEDLIKVALTISRKVTAYSLLEEITEVQGMFCYSYEELSQEPDEKIVKKCQNLLHFIRKNPIELADYDIDNYLGDKLLSLIDRFQLILETKNLYLENSVVSNDYITHLFKETDLIYVESVQAINAGSVLKTS